MDTLTAPPTDALDKAVSDGKKTIEAELKKNGSPLPSSALPPGATEEGSEAPADAPPAPAPGSPAPATLPADDSVAFDMTEESIGELYELAFGTVATRPGMEHWELQEIEKNQLARATKAVLDKYGLKVSPVSALVMALGMTIGPRWYIGSQMKKAEAPAPAPAPATPAKAGDKPALPAPAPVLPVEPKEKTGWAGDDRDAGHEPKHTS